jgi:predicted phage baseplate assembly protein
MTLPTPELDDRRFQDIVDEAKRLIPELLPAWTNHNLSDPGVALIELFAWMSEMLLYRLNQVPDRLYVKFLDLVGVQLFGAQAARAELTFFLSAAIDDAVEVPAGTEVATAGDIGDAVVFCTDRDLRIIQPTLSELLTSSGPDRYRDCWDDLQYARATVRCFTSEPATPDDAFYIGFAESLGGLVVRLDVDASVEGLGIEPARPPLAWEAWDGRRWAPVRVQADTTGGLNRDGSIVLVLPAEHEPLALAGTSACWIRGRLLEAEEGQPPYRASPEIGSLSARTLGGAVSAHHGQSVPAESVGRSTGRPGQAFRCRHHPVLPRRAGETVRTVTRAGATEWTEVADFSRSGPDDLHVTWDGASGEIRFGPLVHHPDGTTIQHGAVPPDGADVVVADHRYGGGVDGNVGAETLTVLRTTVPYVDRVTNLDRATGGVDPESIDNARIRGPLLLRAGERAVSADDYERLALDAAPVVARARCLPPTGDDGAVRLLVVPRVEDRPVDDLRVDDLRITDELFATLHDHLEPRRVLGTTVRIGTPYYRGASVATLLVSRPGTPTDLVRQRAQAALHRFLHPTVGGSRGTGWPFDTNLSSAAIHELLAVVEGVDHVSEVVLFAADPATGERFGRGGELLRIGKDALFLSCRHQVVVR